MDASRHFALLVGLSRYPSIGDLRGPINDLTDVQSWLTAGLGVPEANITVFSDTPTKFRKPSVDAFYDCILDWVDQAEARGGAFPLGERLYVYFAGHGFNATTAQQSLILPRSTPETWNVVPLIPLRESLRLRAHFREVVLIFDACRDSLSYAVDPVWFDKPDPAPQSNQVRVFCASASKAGKKAKEVDFGQGRWSGVLTRAFLAGVKGYAADENGVVWAHTLRAFLYAAVKDRLGVEFEPDIADESDPEGNPWALLEAPRLLPRLLIRPVHTTSGIARFKRRGGEPVEIDLAQGPRVMEVPYGYYVLTLPNGRNLDLIAAWEEKTIDV